MDIAFLSGDPDEHHQLVNAGGRPAEATFSTSNQVSFRVNDLEELKRYYEVARQRGRDMSLVDPRPWECLERLLSAIPREIGWQVYFPSPW